MRDENELSEEEICRIASKYVGAKREKQSEKPILMSVEEARVILSGIPEECKFALYTDNIEDIEKIISINDVKVLSKYPLINSIVVFGKRKKIFHLVLNDLVKEFDVIREIRKVEGNDNRGESI